MLGVIPVVGLFALAHGEGEVGRNLVDPLIRAQRAAELEFAGHAVGLTDLEEEGGVVGGIPGDIAEVLGLVAFDGDVRPHRLADGCKLAQYRPR